MVYVDLGTAADLVGKDLPRLPRDAVFLVTWTDQSPYQEYPHGFSA